MQGATLNVNIIGQYTTFNTNTVFGFGPGITVNSQNVLGPTVATVNMSINQLAQLGYQLVTETSGSEFASTAYAFSVTPSQAIIQSLTPNTALQGTSISVLATGSNTHWDGTTTFSLGAGITVASVKVSSPTSATLGLIIDPLATVGVYTLTAQTGGESASLANAFVVQPGTPLILSSGPGSAPQQSSVTFTILGQSTNWTQGTTTVSLGAGVTVTSITVTSPTAITATAIVQATALTGPRDLTVTTGTQLLTYGSAFYVTSGPAAIALLVPAQGNQGQTLNVAITGSSTNFLGGATTANFGQGVTVNSLTVNSLTSATANVSISAYATPQSNTISLTTLGETAIGQSAFEIVQATPVLTYVSPSSGFQGTTTTVTISALFTHFNSSTVFNFGAGITVNSVLLRICIRPARISLFPQPHPSVHEI